jgi:hypothetical protein
LHVISTSYSPFKVLRYDRPHRAHAEVRAPYYPNQPIENLFQQILDARAFAVADGQPNGEVILNVVFTLVFNTGLFPDAYHAWQA